MKTVTISSFKAHSLRILDQVSKTYETIVITRRGKPLAEIIPFKSKKSKPVPGKLSHTLVAEKDIVTPFGEDQWETSSNIP